MPLVTVPAAGHGFDPVAVRRRDGRGRQLTLHRRHGVRLPRLPAGATPSERRVRHILPAMRSPAQSRLQGRSGDMGR